MSLGHGHAHRGHEMGALAIGDQVLESFLRLRFGRMASDHLRDCIAPGQASHGGASPLEISFG